MVIELCGGWYGRDGRVSSANARTVLRPRCLQWFLRRPGKSFKFCYTAVFSVTNVFEHQYSSIESPRRVFRIF